MASYVYDAYNHRVSSMVSGSTLEYMFDWTWRKVATWLTSPNFGIGGRLFADGKQVAFRASQTFFDHADYLGTERARTNYQGQLATVDITLPFGDGYSQQNPIAYGNVDTLQFGELDYQSESNTNHAGFREYSPTSGRWLSPDPYDGSYDLGNPQSLNRYSYVLNNPLSLVDPLGLEDTDDPCDEWTCFNGGGPGAVDGGGDNTGTCLAHCGAVDPCPSDNCGANTPENPPPSSGSPYLLFLYTSFTPGGLAPSNGRQPNKITCGTVLPDGTTVGSRVAALSNTVNNAIQGTSTPYGPGASYAPGYSPFSVPGQVYTQTNFKIILRGQGNAAFLGDAGNFAYAAVSANIGVPLFAVEGVAGLYAGYAGHKDTAGFFGMDTSARNQIPPGYSAACKGH